MSNEKRNTPPFRVGLLSTPTGKNVWGLSHLLRASSVDQGHICVRGSDMENLDMMEIYRQFGVSNRNRREYELDNLTAEDLTRIHTRTMLNVSRDYGSMGSEAERGITIGDNMHEWIEEGWNYHGGRLVSFEDMTDQDWKQAHSYINYFGRQEESYLIDSLSGYFYTECNDPDYEDVWCLLRQHEETNHIEYSNKLKGGFKPGKLQCISVGRQCGKSRLVKEYFKAEIYVAMDEMWKTVRRHMACMGFNLQLLAFEDKDIMILLFGKYNDEILEGYSKWKQLKEKHRSR